MSKLELLPGQYLAGMNAGDAGAVTSLYAIDAIIEDPVGTEPRVGIDAIREFYDGATAGKLDLELTGPVCVAGNAVAFPFSCRVEAMGVCIDIIDVFECNADGRIQTMRAYWGEANTRPV